MIKEFLQKILPVSGRRFNLIIWFTLLMLVPNMILAYTEPYSISTTIASLALPATFYLLWAILLPQTGRMILWAIPWMVLCAFQVVISYLFGNSIIAVDMFTNLFTTTPSEAGELLVSIWPAVLFVCLLYLPLILWGIRLIRRREITTKDIRKTFLTVAILLFITGGGAATVSTFSNPGFGIKYHIFPVNVCYNIKLSLERWQQSKNYFATSAGFRFGAEKEFGQKSREIYLLVIGEASRAASWSLFGYNRVTTPGLEATKGVIPFKDVLTQSNTTHKSVPILLSPSAAEDYENIYRRKSVISLFKEAGFRSLFISNQPPNRSLIDFFASEADSLVHLAGKNGSKENVYDGEMLPLLSQIIHASDENLFIVLHMYGSHATHNKRYPREMARYLPDDVPSVSHKNKDKIVNAYDNSICYTDKVLTGMINILQENNCCSGLLFCSDHGEDLLDDKRERFLHASPTTTYYQLHVAALSWLSQEYRERYPEKAGNLQENASVPVTTASIFHTLGDLAGISSGYIDPTFSLASPLLTVKNRTYINDYNKAVNVLHTGIAGYDLEMFNRHNISYNPKEIRNIKH